MSSTYHTSSGTGGIDNPTHTMTDEEKAKIKVDDSWSECTRQYEAKLAAEQQNPNAAQTIAKKEDEAIGKMLHALNIGSCTRATGAVVNALPPLGAGFNYSTGCESIAVLASTFVKTTDIFSCTSNLVSNKVSVNGSSDQKVIYDFDEGAEMHCENWNVNQSAGLKLIDSTQIATELENKLTAEMVAEIRQAMSSQSENKTDFLGSADGQKTLERALGVIEDKAFVSSNNKVANNIVKTLTTGQEIRINLGKNAKIYVDKDCKIKQSAAIDIATQNLLTNQITNTLDVSSLSDFFSDQKQENKVQAGGMAQFIGAMIGLVLAVAVLIGIVALVFAKVATKGPVGKAVEIVIIIGILIGGGFLGYYIYTKLKPSEQQEFITQTGGTGPECDWVETTTISDGTSVHTCRRMKCHNSKCDAECWDIYDEVDNPSSTGTDTKKIKIWYPNPKKQVCEPQTGTFEDGWGDEDWDVENTTTHNWDGENTTTHMTATST